MFHLGVDSLPHLLETLGYLGIFAVVFIESGIPFGFFLPGDSFIFTAGLLASQGIFNPFILVPLIVVAAITGDNAGYWLGSYTGRKLWKKDDGFFFNKQHRERTEAFYKKYGARAIILARFIPVVRTFVPFFAGVAHMHYNTFIRYNIIGGIVWGAGITLLGYLLGAIVPDIDQYLIPIVLGIIFVSFIPVFKELFEAKFKKKAL